MADEFFAEWPTETLKSIRASLRSVSATDTSFLTGLAMVCGAFLDRELRSPERAKRDEATAKATEKELKDREAKAKTEAEGTSSPPPRAAAKA